MKPDFAAEDAMLHRLDRESDDRTARIKAMLHEKGRPDLVAELEHNLKEVATGVSQARSTWHSISDAQRRALQILSEGSGRAVRECHGTLYMTTLKAPLGAATAVGRVKTIRNLAARGLVDWDGGAFDPEAAVVLSERGRFTIAHAPRCPS